jgi:hypothetical protein
LTILGAFTPSFGLVMSMADKPLFLLLVGAGQGARRSAHMVYRVPILNDNRT